MGWGNRKRARFRRLVLPHMDALHGYATRRVGDPELASDLTQETFLRAWKAVDSLRDDGAMRAWLYQILRSVLQERGRKSARRSRLVAIEPMDPGVEDRWVDDDDPFDSLISHIDGRRAVEALQNIPEVFAVPVELHDLEGFRYREIAEILGIPKGTVMSRISRGRRLLARMLAPGVEVLPVRKASS